MKNSLNRWAKLSEIRMAFLVMVVCWILATMFFSLISNAVTNFERYSPRSWWYTYEKVEPTSDFFLATEFPTFKSYAVVERDMSFSWEDRLKCLEGGLLISYNSDTDSGFIRGGTVLGGAESKAWEYNEQPFKKNTEKCYMTGTIRGVTPRGFEKIQTYETDWFEVRQ